MAISIPMVPYASNKGNGEKKNGVAAVVGGGKARSRPVRCVFSHSFQELQDGIHRKQKTGLLCSIQEKSCGAKH